MKREIGVAAAFLILGLVGCSKHPAGSITFLLASGPPLHATGREPSLSPAPGGVSVALGTDTLFVHQVELVLRDLEIAPAEAGDCGGSAEEDEPACAQLAAGPLLLRVPLGTTAESTLSVRIPSGHYSLLQFQIQTLDAKGDSAFLSAHPELGKASIRVLGTFSKKGLRKEVSYTLPFNEREQLDLDPPLAVATGGTARLALRVDLATWFLNAERTALVDPASAVPGQSNENLVRDNIRMSLNANRDDSQSAP